MFVEIEDEHPDGMTTQEVLEVFAVRGERLTEAAFRKYVQLGLLPRSVRIGRKGKHRGSQGLYPSSIVRQIDLIRRLMAQGLTIEEIQRDFPFLGGNIDEIEQRLNRVFAGIGRAASSESHRDANDEVLHRALGDARATADELVRKLRAIEQRLLMRARMARAVV
jgi:hypothetical protein